MLTEEAGTASNIKSRVNRLSVLDAIYSTQNRLKLYSKLPPNGLVIYCGSIMTESGKEKQVTIDFQPFRPINTSLYICDQRFRTEPLACLLESNVAFGFIIMDGSGALFGKISGNNRTILQQFSVDLPKKHGRGGQSALRFARLRLEKRHNYLRKVAELATVNFITNDVPNVTGLVLAGLSLFKNDLSKSDLFDPRLQKVVISIVDIAYGGENGFNQAIELASESLLNVRFVAEKKLLGRLFEEIDKDSGKFCYGIRDVIQAIEQGAIETLIIWEDLEMDRLVLKNKETHESQVQFFTPEQRAACGNSFKDTSGVDLELIEECPVTEYFAENYKQISCKLEFVSDKSEEGSQFCRGFGGIGGILRYKCDFYDHNYEQNNDDDEDSEFI